MGIRLKLDVTQSRRWQSNYRPQGQSPLFASFLPHLYPAPLSVLSRISLPHLCEPKEMSLPSTDEHADSWDAGSSSPSAARDTDGLSCSLALSG